VLNFEGGSVFCREIYKIDIYPSTPSNIFSSQNFLLVTNIYLQFGQMQNQKETIGNSHGMNDRGEICNVNRMLHTQTSTPCWNSSREKCKKERIELNWIKRVLK
jgi:hypothetical protein